MKVKKSTRAIVTLCMVFALLLTMLPQMPVNAAKKIVKVSKSKITLNKSTPKKIKVICNKNNVSLSFTVQDDDVVTADWVKGDWKTDKKGNSYTYIKAKGHKNGKTKIHIRNDYNSSVTSVTITVKGFSAKSQWDKLVKKIKKEADDVIDFDGVTYKSATISLEPFLDAGYNASTGDVLFALTIRYDKSKLIDQRTERIQIIYNQKHPEKTTVRVYEYLQWSKDMGGSFYIYEATTTINASNFKAGDAVKVESVTENSAWDSMEAMRRVDKDGSYTLTEEDIAGYMQSVLKNNLSTIDTTLSKYNYPSLNSIGFKKI